MPIRYSLVITISIVNHQRSSLADGATNSASAYIMGATNAGFIVIFNKFAMYD